MTTNIWNCSSVNVVCCGICCAHSRLAANVLGGREGVSVHKITPVFVILRRERVKICWHRVTVPEDIVELLINLDIDVCSYIKSPWTQNKIKKGEYRLWIFTAITAVPQGSSEGGIVWIIIFDVLITMLHIGECINFLIKMRKAHSAHKNPLYSVTIYWHMLQLWPNVNASRLK